MVVYVFSVVLVIWQGSSALCVGDGEWDMEAIPKVRWEGIVAVQGRDKERRGKVR